MAARVNQARALAAVQANQVVAVAPVAVPVTVVAPMVVVQEVASMAGAAQEVVVRPVVV